MASVNLWRNVAAVDGGRGERRGRNRSSRKRNRGSSTDRRDDPVRTARAEKKFRDAKRELRAGGVSRKRRCGKPLRFFRERRRGRVFQRVSWRRPRRR